MPPLMGMLVAGIVLRNVPIDLVSGLKSSWAKEIRYGCLAVIFLMSGLEQDVEVCHCLQDDHVSQITETNLRTYSISR